MSNVIIRNRRIFTAASGGVDPALESRVEVLEQNEYKITYYEQVSSTTGTVTPPTGSTIMLDQFTGGVDAYVSQIAGGKPTGDFPNTAGGVAVDVATFDSSGNWTLTGTPSSYPVAIIYVIRIAAVDYNSVDLDYVITVEDFNNTLGLGEVGYGDPTTGRLISSPRSQFFSDVSATYARYQVGGNNRHGQIYISNTIGSSFTILENDYLTTGGTFNLRPSAVAAFQFTGTGYIYGDTIKPYIQLTDASGTYIGYNSSSYATGFFGNGTAYIDSPLIKLQAGIVATNMGLSVDATGVKISPYSNLATANTYPFEVQDTAGNSIIHHNGLVNDGGLAIQPKNGGTTLNFKYLSAFSGWYIQPAISNTFSIYAANSISRMLWNIDGSVYSNGVHRWEQLAGTGDRMMEVDSDGDQSATVEILDTYIVDATVIGLLEDTANWDILGEYTGTAITDTYQGQMHFDDNYLFHCVSDNNWIRIPRA